MPESLAIGTCVQYLASLKLDRVSAPRIEQLSMIILISNLVVEDLEETRTFYRDFLSLRIGMFDLNHGSTLVLACRKANH